MPLSVANCESQAQPSPRRGWRLSSVGRRTALSEAGSHNFCQHALAVALETHGFGREWAVPAEMPSRRSFRQRRGWVWDLPPTAGRSESECRGRGSSSAVEGSWRGCGCDQRVDFKFFTWRKQLPWHEEYSNITRDSFTQIVEVGEVAGQLKRV